MKTIQFSNSQVANRNNVNNQFSSKTLQQVVIVAVLALASCMPMAAQVRLGIKGGLTLNEMRFDSDIINSENRLGYTAGLTLDIAIPHTGLGIEASALYAHRENRIVEEDRVYKRDMLEFPVYARYRLGIGALSKVIDPYAFTGPKFSVLCAQGNNNITYKDEGLHPRKTSLTWEVGAGVELANHLRISASYGIGITKPLEYVNDKLGTNMSEGKEHNWSVSATYLF